MKPSRNSSLKTEVLNVKGMTCDGWVDGITRSLKSKKGVHGVAADLEAGNVTIEFDPARCSIGDLRAAVAGAGYEVAEPASRRKAGGGCCGS